MSRLLDDPRVRRDLEPRRRQEPERTTMGRRRKGDAVSGWICLDKPLDLGSTQAVGRVRRAFNAQKAGHAGTLDPAGHRHPADRAGRGDQDRSVPDGRRQGLSLHHRTGASTTASFDREGAVTATSDVRPTPRRRSPRR